jgi:hypothetical protein
VAGLIYLEVVDEVTGPVMYGNVGLSRDGRVVIRPPPSRNPAQCV